MNWWIILIICIASLIFSQTTAETAENPLKLWEKLAIVPCLIPALLFVMIMMVWFSLDGIIS